MACHLFLQCPLFGTMSHFKTLPKFAQIPDWWRHTGSSVNFLTTGPIFFNVVTFFTLEMVQPYLLGQKVLFFYITFYIRSKCRNTPIFTHLAPMTSQIWASVNKTHSRAKNTQTSNEENFVKDSVSLNWRPVSGLQLTETVLPIFRHCVCQCLSNLVRW